MKTFALLSVSIVALVSSALGQDAPQSTPQSSAASTANTPAPANAPSSSSSSSSSAPAAETERRFTGGVTLSVLGFGSIPKATSTVNNTAEISTQYQTTDSSERIGYGINLQARLTQHFYIDLSAELRRIGYQETTTISTTTTSQLDGVSYPSTSTTSTHEDTHSRFIDVPLLLRYYGTGKRPESPRWFLEAGGTWRLANDIRTSLDSTDSSGTVTCCTFTPTVPQHRSAIGLTTGAGMQFVDEFGIHVLPEFRYTRWETPIFNNLTTDTQKNQIEADLSFTF